MKSIADYVALEPEYYQNILDDYQTLFTQHIDLVKLNNLTQLSYLQQVQVLMQLMVQDL